MYSTTIASVLFFSLAFYVNGQNEMPVSGCILSNITLNFKPAIDKSRTVKSYTWNKDIGPNLDPSFAKYEPDPYTFETYMDDTKGRIVHNPEEPTTLYLINLRQSDAAKYTLVVRYVTFTGDSPEYKITITVKDVCLDEATQVGKCSITTCYAGENGMLETPMGKEAVNGHKLVKVCKDDEAGNYTCCNNAKMCKSLKLEVFQEEDTSTGDMPPKKEESGTTIVVVIVVIVVIVLVAGAVGGYLFYKKRNGQRGSDQGKTTQLTVDIKKEDGKDHEKVPFQKEI